MYANAHRVSDTRILEGYVVIDAIIIFLLKNELIINEIVV